MEYFLKTTYFLFAILFTAATQYKPVVSFSTITCTSQILTNKVGPFFAVSNKFQERNKPKNGTQSISIDQRLQELRFGFEVIERGIMEVDEEKFPRTWPAQKTRLPYALCKPSRGIGCAPLLDDSVLAPLEPLNAFELPCVVSGKCPFVVFRCNRGHSWKALSDSPACFFCPDCRFPQKIQGLMRARRCLTLEALQEIAKNRGGQVLSKKYVGIRSKYLFQCKHKHTWNATANNVVHQKTWCPVCAQLDRQERQRLTIDDMHNTALFFGGKFQSKSYSSAKQKLQWKCKRGHVFFQTANNIRRKKSGKKRPVWCPECHKIDGPPHFFH